MTKFFPLAIPTADNTAITADTISFTADGADLINGGAWSVRKKGVSYTVSDFVATQRLAKIGSTSTPFPVLYPPQTFYVNGLPVTI